MTGLLTYRSRSDALCAVNWNQGARTPDAR